jgi:hypothetical protein
MKLVSKSMLALFAAALGCSIPALAGDAAGDSATTPAGPRVTYIRAFPGSDPAYIFISIDHSGAGVYKEAVDDNDPESFQLEDFAAARIFDLTDKLDHFKGKVESGLKVANMGAKTFRWEEKGTSTEAQFNYSTDVNAQALQNCFESIADSERAFFQFRLAVKHDKLGVQDALLQMSDLWDRGRLVGTQQFLPLLDRVIKDDSYIHIAQQRAATLAAAIRAAGPGKGPA